MTQPNQQDIEKGFCKEHKNWENHTENGGCPDCEYNNIEKWEGEIRQDIRYTICGVYREDKIIKKIKKLLKSQKEKWVKNISEEISKEMGGHDSWGITYLEGYNDGLKKAIQIISE